MRPNREAFFGGCRRDNRALKWRMCEKLERDSERLSNELFRARLFERWIDDVVVRTIGDGGEKEDEDDEDEDDEMGDVVGSEIWGKVEEGGDEMEDVETERGEEEKRRVVRGRRQSKKSASRALLPALGGIHELLLGSGRKLSALGFWQDTTSLLSSN
jgi:hypothetical protein